jgi:hypothetical protein
MHRGISYLEAASVIRGGMFPLAEHAPVRLKESGENLTGDVEEALRRRDNSRERWNRAEVGDGGQTRGIYLGAEYFSRLEQ